MNADQAVLAGAMIQNRMMGIGADDPTQRQYLGIIIEYVGAQPSCLITTASNNSIASAVGAASGEVADPNFTVGSTPGTIDLTNAAADTMGEVVDLINGLADYKARLVACRRADDSDTTGALVAVSGIQAKVPGGLGLALDTSVCDHVSCEISALDGMIASGTVEGQVGSNGDSKRVAVNALVRVSGTLAYTGNDLFRVYEVDDENKTDELIYQQLVSVVIAATTVAGSTTFPGDGIVARNGRRLIVRASAATTMAVTNYNVQGTTKVLV